MVRAGARPSSPASCRPANPNDDRAVPRGLGPRDRAQPTSGAPDGPFDERRTGLDHVGFAVDNREALDAWQARLADLGVEHSPVEDTASGSALVFRDPDQIQLEMWWTKPRVG
nr:VOC family protein [Candidatus Microthrix sp.]